jgi:methylenetetrahydrofolate reductase (NADPH)
MMNAAELTARFLGTAPTVSVEFFPPKTPEATFLMLAEAAKLRPLGIDLASITYGAGGSTRETTLVAGRELVALGYGVIGHLTCVGHSRAELEALVDRYAASGFAGILALRGDPPRGETGFTPHPQGLRHAAELVALARARLGDRLALGVAGFPEGHPDSPSAEEDLRWFAQKVRAGADFVTTQLFFDNADYLSYVARSRAAGVRVPILPGILPVRSLKQVRNFCALARARLPRELEGRLEACGDDESAQLRVGLDWAEAQIAGLLSAGAPGVHLYIVNKADTAIELLGRLRGRGLPAA